MAEQTAVTDRPFVELLEGVGHRLAPSFTEDWPGLPVVSGRGLDLETADGRHLLDFTAGIATANTGHCHPRVVDAAKRQIEALMHGPIGIMYHEPLLRLAESLTRWTPGDLDMFFFANSGAEAVEGAVKLARYVTGRPAVIAFTGGFHGRTYMAASLTTAKARYRLHYEPFVGSVYFSPYADPFHGGFGEDGERCARHALDQLAVLLDRVVPPEHVACLVVEPVQGEGGYVIPPPRFLAGLRDICNQIGALLVFDEVQTGFGRTGEMFAAQTFGVTPDVMAVGKGIASGLPLSATIAPERLMSRWLAGSHGTTFGGNPVACAAALASLQVIEEEGLLANARAQGARLLAGLHDIRSGHPRVVADSRGVGLMCALEFGGASDSPGMAGTELAQQLLEGCLDRGLLLYAAGAHNQVVRLMPALILNSAQVDRALGIIDDSIASVEAALGPAGRSAATSGV
ncbi:MAG TPA: aminotransferase class III-fold pyridoxal phosphate-dependent enzyme [Candidatus Binatia bacterium]|nr:aminotransferase class III-fold pyridoxal phosphate-dependent enzyme [Candidatus Binatia bacterium]